MVIRWWTALDAEGKELRKERRPYLRGDLWWCGGEAPKITAMGFSATRTGPFLEKVPVRTLAQRGDRIAVATPQPITGEDTELRLVRALPKVCELPACGCSGLEHP